MLSVTKLLTQIFLNSLNEMQSQVCRLIKQAS